MNILSIFVLAVLAISIFTIGITLTYAMVNNFNKGKAVRQHLMSKINQLRYGKALSYFGINKNEFLHKVPLVEIEKEIRSCQGCQQIASCDKTLGKTEVYEQGELAFCPNSASIQIHKAA